MAVRGCVSLAVAFFVFVLFSFSLGVWGRVVLVCVWVCLRCLCAGSASAGVESAVVPGVG